MPADSLLTQQIKSTPPGSSATWDQVEAAVEVLGQFLKTISTGAGSSSGATAANQTTQITAEQAIVPGTVAAAVTPSDSTALTSRAVWVGGAGDLSVRLSGTPSTTVVFTAVPAGTLLPISVVRIMAATTATNINTIG